MPDITPQILYIDDEPDNLKVFRLTFSYHYDVLTGDSAKVGFEILADKEVHVVIADQRMPGMTGVEFLEQVKREYPDIPRIILTGYSDMSAVISAINKGRIYHYISKPWEEEELKIVIDNAYKHYALTKENQVLMRQLEEANQELSRYNLSLEEKVQERSAQLLDQTKKMHEVRQQILEMELENTREQKKQIQNEINVINKKFTTLSLQSIQKTKLLDELKGQLSTIMERADETSANQIRKAIKFIVSTLNSEKDWEEFKYSFENVHQDFFDTLKKRFPELTPNEMHLCALLKLNMNIKKAAQILGIAPDSVKMARYRIRKKMDLDKDANLIDFIMSL